MTRRLPMLAVLAVLAACGRPPKDAEAPIDPQAGGSGRVDAGQVAPAGDAGSTVLTGAECDRLVDHVVALAAAMRTGEARSTDEEIAAASERLRTEMRGACLELGRDMYDCVLAATDAAGVAACQPPPE